MRMIQIASEIAAAHIATCMDTCSLCSGIFHILVCVRLSITRHVSRYRRLLQSRFDTGKFQLAKARLPERPCAIVRIATASHIGKSRKSARESTCMVSEDRSILTASWAHPADFKKSLSQAQGWIESFATQLCFTIEQLSCSRRNAMWVTINNRIAGGIHCLSKRMCNLESF